jgi:hypothetical protein
MADPFSGGLGTTKQEVDILGRAAERKKATSFKLKNKGTEDGEEKRKKKAPTRVSELYNAGIALLKAKGFVVELDESGDHCRHRILKPSPPPMVRGIKYPNDFNPLQDISIYDDFERVELCFHPDLCPEEVRVFWEPLYRPKGGDSELLSFTERLLKMKRANQNKHIHETLDYGHTFDPAGRWGGDPVLSPRIWVPDREWFDPVLHRVSIGDVFTIFPDAEKEMLKLILGRIGIGRSNHLPPGRDKPIDHTARMAAVIVGKDAGLGKSTLFNGMTAAFSKCGFVTHTFKSTEDRFGLKAAALSDVSYKDDTSLSSLKKFLAAEETKILITNGLFQVEEKFQNAEQVWPKTVMILNANDWNSKFAYDLDPGIIDRIKLISTYREYEVHKNRALLEGTASEGSPDLRPRSHIPFLANKLGVSADALYLWCLRLSTDKFWEIINDTSDPSINRLQVEVRYWTTRQRIRFKADVTQALVNAMAFAHSVRTESAEDFMPEMTPDILYEYLKSLYFVGVDPSCQQLTAAMKRNWEMAGRPSTHYYQGFRELRWESVRKAIALAREILFDESSGLRKETKEKTALVIIREVMEKLVLRDGFKIGGEANYVIENWENCRHAQEELVLEGRSLVSSMKEEDLSRLRNLKIQCSDDWLLSKNYSPDRAEKYREEARELIYNRGVKV